MRKFELKRITVALRQMSPAQRKVVATELAALDTQPASTVLVESRFAAAATCPHCKARRVIRHGHANGLQRYRCRDCRKTFSALTGTPLARLRGVATCYPPKHLGWFRALDRESASGSKPAQWLAMALGGVA